MNSSLFTLRSSLKIALHLITKQYGNINRTFNHSHRRILPVQLLRSNQQD